MFVNKSTFIIFVISLTILALFKIALCIGGYQLSAYYVNGVHVSGWGNDVSNRNKVTFSDELVSMYALVTGFTVESIIYIPYGLLSVIVAFTLLLYIPKYLFLIQNSKRICQHYCYAYFLLLIYVWIASQANSLDLWTLGTLFFLSLQYLLIRLLSTDRKIPLMLSIIFNVIALSFTYYVLVISYIAQLFIIILILNILPYHNKILRLKEKEYDIIITLMISATSATLIHMFMGNLYILVRYITNIEFDILKTIDVVLSRATLASYSYQIAIVNIINKYMSLLRLIFFRAYLLIVVSLWLYIMIKLIKEKINVHYGLILSLIISFMGASLIEVMLYAMSGHALSFRTLILLSPIILTIFFYSTNRKTSLSKMRPTVYNRSTKVTNMLFAIILIISILYPFSSIIHEYTWTMIIDNNKTIRDAILLADFIVQFNKNDYSFDIVSDHFYSAFLALEISKELSLKNYYNHSYFSVDQLYALADLLTNSSEFFRELSLRDINTVVIPKRQIGEGYILIYGTSWQGHIHVYSEKDLSNTLDKSKKLIKLFSSGYTDTYLFLPNSSF